MERKAKLAVGVTFLLATLGCCFFQLIVLLTAAVMRFIIWFFAGQVIWHVCGQGPSVQTVAQVISWTLVFGGYAAVWFMFWSIAAQHRSGWFYWQVAFAAIPLIIALALFNPQQDPMAMLPLSAEEITFQFSTLVTGTVLFPLYSIALYQFVFRKQREHRVKNTVAVCLAMLLVGGVIFAASWQAMPLVYGLHGEGHSLSSSLVNKGSQAVFAVKETIRKINYLSSFCQRSITEP